MRRFLPLVLGLTLLPTTALAHAVLVKAVPPHRTTLAESPPRVELWVKERPEPADSRPSGTDQAGAQGGLRDLVVSPGDAKRPSVLLPPLRPRRATVRLRVLYV